jgi:hypothetical protein
MDPLLKYRKQSSGIFNASKENINHNEQVLSHSEQKIILTIK